MPPDSTAGKQAFDKKFSKIIQKKSKDLAAGVEMKENQFNRSIQMGAQFIQCSVSGMSLIDWLEAISQKDEAALAILERELPKLEEYNYREQSLLCDAIYLTTPSKENLANAISCYVNHCALRSAQLGARG